MPSVSSANKNYELMATGENVGTWGIKTNSNLSLVDLNFGGRLTVSVAGSSNVTISSSQAANVYHTLTGTITASIAYIVPTQGSFYIVSNQTSGAFSVTVRMATGTGVVVPQGQTIGLFANPDGPAVVTFFTALGYTLPISQGGTGQTTAGAAAIALLANSFVGGTSTGTANAQTVAATSPGAFVRTTGNRLLWTPGFANTAAATLDDGGGAIALRKITPAGLAALSGGELVAAVPVVTEWNGTFHVLLTNVTSWGGPFTNLASATTTDLGTIPSRAVTITGTTTITSLGSSASTTYPLYNLLFSGALTLTHNGTSLIVPGSASITTAVGDSAVAQYLGSGNWRIVSYTRASGRDIIDPVPMIGLTSPLGLVVSATSSTTVTVTARQVTMTNGTYVYADSTVSLSISIAVSGVNGLDTGAEAPNTWYFVYAIYNPTTGATAGLLSTSATAPTLPAGYTYSRRLGAVRNDSGSNLYQSTQRDSYFSWNYGSNPGSALIVTSGTSGGTTVSLGSYMPTTAIGFCGVARGTFSASSSQAIVVGKNSAFTEFGIGAPGSATAFRCEGPFTLWGSSLYYEASGTSLSVAASGYVDSI